MTKSELKTIIRSILKEELLREADKHAVTYTFYYAGSALDEEKFKQKLILTMKSLKSISNIASIAEAAEVITSGLKEGAEFKGVSIFELGNKSFIVKARQGGTSNTTDSSPEVEEV